MGIMIDPFSMEETVHKIHQAVKLKQRLRVVTANPELIMRSGREASLRELINSADIVTADGVGVVWAASVLGTPVKERVTGIDLLHALFPWAGTEKWRIFFLGGKPEVAKLAANRVANEYPGISWQAAHGYFQPDEEPDLVSCIQEFQPDLLLVGLGAPRQEYWIANHQDLAAVCIGVGGSFDALSGLVRRAPRWIRDLRVEWLYRLAKEPKRWRRQLALPRFVIRVLQAKWFK